jgi:alpha-L-rhamnosidase
MTARGVFELHLNGRRVGCDRFAPGWTDYRRRIQVSTYDVADHLREGENAVGAILGDGWYAGRIRGLGRRFWYGEQLSLLVQIEVEHADGSRTRIAGDEAWKTSTGPILGADFYDGEDYDARLEMRGWSEPGFDDSVWSAARLFTPPEAALVPSRSVPIRPQEELSAQGFSEPRPGVFVFDLGQNMTGLARIRLRQPRGREIVVRYAEMLDAEGTLYTENLRTAKCTDRYICRGGEELFEPHFTFHGFRYVELTGIAGRPEREDVVGVVLHSDMARTGDFACSDERVNRLYSCIVWGQKGNFLDIPTDCPQRDERLGWTGDAQVFAKTACLNFDATAFFGKWCVDVDDAQRPDGAFTNTAPDVYDGAGGEAAWGDAGVICPWAAYRFSGDAAILERHYAAMTKWIRWRERNSPGLIHAHAAWGDWLAIDASPDDLGRSPTPRDLIGTAYFAHSTAIVAKVARVLGRRADAVRFSKLAKRIRAAFNREFVAPSGRIVGDSQTGYLLALGFDLLPAAKRGHALERLVKDIESRGWHLSTGFVGTPLIAPVLTRFGRGDVALKLLLQTTYPSWLYPVLQGATTMWERWNSFTLDQGFGSAGMNSFNHYAYGAVGEWLYGAVGGIELDPDEPGGRRIVFRPCVGGGLTWARCTWKSPYGTMSSAWRLEGGRLKLDIALPPNTRGTVMLPGRRPVDIGPGEHRFKARHKEMQ